jgi:AcrR family transcriptional regulator
MRKDTLITRAKIISTAERLYAESGIDAVSLNEITREAEQKNKSALTYHFGGKEGLLKAIIEKHLEGVLEQLDIYLDDLELQNAVTLENVIRSVVYALAAKLDDEDGGRHCLSILAQLVSLNNRHSLSVNEFIGEDHRLMVNLQNLTDGTPDVLRSVRLMQGSQMLFHSLSHLAIIMNKKPGTSPFRSHDHLNKVFIDSLVDSLVAIANIEPSQATQMALAEAG